jgi:hypothetical protein
VSQEGDKVGSGIIIIPFPFGSSNNFPSQSSSLDLSLYRPDDSDRGIVPYMYSRGLPISIEEWRDEVLVHLETD